MTLRVVKSHELNEIITRVFEDNTTTAQFLQSLDVDGNSSNGIKITEEIKDVLRVNNINIIPSSYTAIEDMVRILQDESLEENSRLEYSGRAVNDTEVQEHLSETREELNITEDTVPVRIIETVLDEIVPVITIIGDNLLSIIQHSIYEEQGVIAIDEVDGTLVVSTSGSVDTSTVGSYTITYIATDSSNNTATATRTVIVIATSEVIEETIVIDITDEVLSNGSGNCADFVASYSSAVTDIQNDTDFEGSLEIEVTDSECIFTSNVIPNHDFNDETAHFTNAVEAQFNDIFSLPTSPTPASNPTYLVLGDNAIFLNGVKLSIRSAGCYGVTETGSFQDGYEGVNGCHDSNEPFRYDPLGTSSKFGADAHNAHTQPGGIYHYHGSPLAMYDTTGTSESAIIGFARDGYPIFGSYINDSGVIRKATSSYILKSGARTSVTYNGNTYNPGGRYDGTYVSDWEYSDGRGDLDECNGMTVNGVYGYYAIDSFPWVLHCYKGEI